MTPRTGARATGRAPVALLARCHAAAVAGAQPGPAVAAALASCPLPRPPGRVHLLAVGKAADAMARAAVDALARRGVAPAGGLVVAHTEGQPPAPTLAVVAGDHPIPGARSRRAADALGVAAAQVHATDLAVVLLSGGTSSLIAAPAPASDTDRLTVEHLAAASRALLAAGVPIDVVNAVRKRVSRWGAGRLALALAPAEVLCLAVSDVPGDDPAVIGSGPCVPDPWTGGALRAALEALGVRAVLPTAVRHWIDRAPETPKSENPAFARVRTQVIRTNADARAAAAAVVRAANLDVTVHDAWLDGEAATLGQTIAATLLAAPAGSAHVWGGEPTVTLGPAAHDAAGGRMQELALAAAGALYAAASDDRAAGVALLAAGTDGRDGPTDAAGAIVDGGTWATIRSAGRDPAADLAAHRSHDALGAAGVLLPAAPTGTNVADVIVGVCWG